MVQSYSPGCANVHPHLICASLDPPESITKWNLHRFSHFCTAHSRKSVYFTMGHSFPLKIAFAWGIWTPIQYMVPLAHPSPQQKRHLDQFSSFCKAHNRDRPTDRSRYSICNNRLHLCSTVMWPNNNNDLDNRRAVQTCLTGGWCAADWDELDVCILLDVFWSLFCHKNQLTQLTQQTFSISSISFYNR